MKIEYQIKGITLNEYEMRDIKQHYEILCTAEYLMENYDVAEDEAIQLGNDVRRLMNNYGSTESEAIDEVMQNRDI